MNDNDDKTLSLANNIKKLNSNKFVETISYQDKFENQNDVFLFGNCFINKIKEGDVVEGIVTCVNPNDIVVDVGLKSDGRIPVNELGRYDHDIIVGSKIKVYVEKIEDHYGNVVLSREKAIRDEKWNKLEEYSITKNEIKGVIKRSTKCGFIVDLGDGISAFLPLSHVDIKQLKDFKHLIETEQNFIVLKMDKKQGNIVVSRKLVLEKLHAGEKAKFLESLNDGDIIEGKIKSITHYGVFIGIHESDKVGVIDGLLHITDISWSRISHPSAVFTCGQIIKVKIIKIDKENAKVSLGVKQLGSNPWENIESKYPIESIHKGNVTSIEDYGLFVELEPGIEGLVHSSEISWTKINLPINNFINRGQEVYVKILSMDTSKSRMSLSIKKCIDNPWQIFINKYPIGSIVLGKVKNNSGSYISISFNDNEIDENVEGIVYMQDLNWSKNSLDEIRKYNIGDPVKAKVIKFDLDKAKIYLGIKQIEYDPLVELIKRVKVGDKMQVTIIKKGDYGLIVDVEDGISLLIDQEYLPENRKFSVSEKIEVYVLKVENYNIKFSVVK